MQISEDLNPESATFELRFANAYRLWDSSGSIWSTMTAAHPELTFSNAAPNQQVFESATLQLSLEIGQLKVSGRGPSAIKDVLSICGLFCRTASHHLDVRTYSRAGFRVVNSRSFETSTAALAFVGAERSEEKPSIGDPWQRVGFVTSVRLESESSGLLATLKVEERNIAINIPWEASVYMKSYKEKKAYVIADADFYTIGLIDDESFDPEEWVRQASKAIRRHWSSI